MKQFKIILVLLALGLLFLSAVPKVESSEITADTSNMNNFENERLESENGNGK